MKRTKKALLGVITTILSFGSFALTACGGTPSNSDLVYNEAGQFYEQKVDDMVDCSLFRYNVAQSAMGNPILLNSSNEGVVFTCTTVRGAISEDNKLTLISGEGFWWWPNDDLSLSGTTIDIVLTVEENVVGYAVVEIYPLSEATDVQFAARTLKSVLLPKVRGQSQTVTQEQVQTAINEVKKSPFLL